MKRFHLSLLAVGLLLAGGCAGNHALPNVNPANEPDAIRQMPIALPPADLSVRMSPERQRTDVGDTVTFTIIATNNGPSRSTLDTHVIPSAKLEIVAIQCAFNVSADGTFCEPGVANVGEQFPTIVSVKILRRGNAAMTACVL